MPLDIATTLCSTARKDRRLGAASRWRVGTSCSPAASPAAAAERPGARALAGRQAAASQAARRDRGTRLAGWRAARAQTRRAARPPAQCRAAPVRRSGASSREGLPQPPRVVFYSRRPQARITDAEPDRASMWRVACRTTPRHMPSGASAHDPNPSASQGARPSAATPPPTAAGHWCSTLQQTVNTIQGERTPPS